MAQALADVSLPAQSMKNNAKPETTFMDLLYSVCNKFGPFAEQSQKQWKKQPDSKQEILLDSGS